MQGAAGTQQGELAHALKTGTSTAPRPSMEPYGTATPTLPCCGVTLRTQQLRQEKLPFTSYAKHYPSVRKGVRTSYWLHLHLE